MTDFWNLCSSENETTNEIKKIIKAQSEYLKKDTKGMVRAKFGQIKDVGAISKMSVMLTAVAKATSKEIIEGDQNEDIDTSLLSDANELYTEKRYGYEIYNSSYKFRIFEIILSPMYPVKVKIDFGILEDIRREIESICEIDPDDYSCKIYNDRQFEDCLQLILSNRKVKYIVRQMESVETEQII